MTSPKKTRTMTEFGDFQTPEVLAVQSTELLYKLGIRPQAILEPTCGLGAFLTAAIKTYPEARVILGVDINPVYVEAAARKHETRGQKRRIQVKQGDFFTFDWQSIFAQEKGPWLILGNPPWVTSSKLAALGSDNSPEKTNFHGRVGMDAITGKSNFDISEWMLLRYINWLKDAGTIAVLCKTAVARKVLLHAWKRNIICSSRIYKIDAMFHFGAAVDACLLVMELAPHSPANNCLIFDNLASLEASSTLCLCKGHLASDVGPVNRMEALWGPDEHYTWRSGVKHDCSKVMELTRTGAAYSNGLGETVVLEAELLFPVLKSSDVGNARTTPRGVMIVTQQSVGQDTSTIENTAPKTWRYLTQHKALLNKRGSIIYCDKPPFSVFGVGPYTFAPWKVAVSSLYKKLRFVSVGPTGAKPVVFDDTVYFLPCWSQEEAHFIESLLHSDEAQQFFRPMIHWTDKRAITVDILKRLSLRKLASALGRQAEFDLYQQAGRPAPLVATPTTLPTSQLRMAFD